MRKALLGLLLAVLVSVPLYGKDKELTILRSQKFVFVNSDCEKNQSCDLKKVEYTVERYQIGIGDEYNYGTRFLALYETDSVGTLENYTLVQFIRGCQYSTRVVDGKVETSFDVAIELCGEFVTYRLPDWVVDMTSEYPDYCADDEGRSRHFWCRSKEDMSGDLFDEDGALAYGMDKPETPMLYIVDHPGSFWADSKGVWARNSSIQFRTCIYKTKDVPRTTDPADINLAEPVHCFEWSSSFVYNHEKGEFEELPEIVSQCRDEKVGETENQ